MGMRVLETFVSDSQCDKRDLRRLLELGNMNGMKNRNYADCKYRYAEDVDSRKNYLPRVYRCLCPNIFSLSRMFF